jgi:acetamidase/formamidase
MPSPDDDRPRDQRRKQGAVILQPGEAVPPGAIYLPSSPEDIGWGFLPNASSTPRLEVTSGSTVVIDTVSHEGMLEDQGRDPRAYFSSYGVDPADVLLDACAIAASGIPHDFDDGPHIVTGPIAITGTMPGDVLRVDVIALDLRVPYGVISSRHGRGCLAGEFPLGPPRSPLASSAHPELYGSAFSFVEVEGEPSAPVGVLRYGAGRHARFALAPFLGVMGVAPAVDTPVPSGPPGRHGGNIDVNLLVTGTSLYLPVQVPGASFYVGDPHFAQGDGEVALTALEAPLRATLRLTSVPRSDVAEVVGPIDRPFIETPEFWVPIGLDPDLNEAMRHATRAAVDFLEHRQSMPRSVALAYLSAAADFEVSQVVDGVKGIHCCIRKSDFS